MKNFRLFFFIVGIVAVTAAASACGTTATNTNTANANVRNANNNTAVLVNANNTNSTTNRSDNDVTREEYERDRARYERDRGDSKIGSGPNDSWLWFKTRASLATADDLRDSTINVDVENAVITLRGTVASAAQKQRAETVAKSVEGQNGVKNQLQVRSGDSMTNQMVNGRDTDGRDDGRSNTNRRP